MGIFNEAVRIVGGSFSLVGKRDCIMSKHSFPPSSHVLPAAVIGSLVRQYFCSADKKPWHRFSSFEWDTVDPRRLSDTDRSTLMFVTYIEDHLPGYFSEMLQRFPVDASVTEQEYIQNREIYRFLVRWAQEEDCHAHVLYEYQLRAGLADESELRRKLAAEGRKAFSFSYDDPLQTFTYTFIQEKATQLFYQAFARSISEPVLRSIVLHLARDEARHFAFFASIIDAYTRHFGPSIFPAMQLVLRNFKMPLANTLNNYWRWSLQLAESYSYDHTLAYGHLTRVFNRAAEAAKGEASEAVAEFIHTLNRGLETGL